MDPLSIGLMVAPRIVGGLFGGRGGKKKMKKGYKELSGLGEELRGFDPMGYAQQAAEAQWNMIQSPLAEALQDYRAGQVDRGALRSGPTIMGEDRIVRDVYKNYTDQLAARSMQAGQMRMGALGMAGDVYAGIYDQGARERQSSQNWWSGLGRDIAASYLFGGKGT